MLCTCPNHGLDKKTKSFRFYRRLTKLVRNELDYSSRGGFLNSEVDEALNIIELSVNSSFEDATEARSFG